MRPPRVMISHRCGHLQSHRLDPEDAGRRELLRSCRCNYCWSRSLEGRPPLAYLLRGRIVVVNAASIAAPLRAAGYCSEYAYVPERLPAAAPSRQIIWRGAPSFLRSLIEPAAGVEALRALGCEIQEIPD